MTKEEIEALKVGDILQEIGENWWDVQNGKIFPNARWLPPHAITRIYARGIDVDGRAYVCFYTESGSNSFYTESGSNSTISGGITEGEKRYRLLPPPSGR